MKLTAIILAGGKSSRMGEDKGLMVLGQKPMIQYVIDLVKPFVDSILLISNNKAYQQFGYPVFEDTIQHKGPLAGILTGLQHSTTNKNLVLSCDTPFVSAGLIELLINSCTSAAVVIPKKGIQTHPLIGIYDTLCCNIFEKELKKNRLKLQTAIEKVNHRIIDANHFDNQVFHNINTKEDVNN